LADIAGDEGMTSTAIDRVKSRKNFYRNLYRKEIILLMALLLMMFVWVVMIVYVATHRKVSDFYASSSNGIITPLKPMPVPNRSNKPLLEDVD
jgi:hypothetical protein